MLPCPGKCGSRTNWSLTRGPGTFDCVQGEGAEGAPMLLNGGDNPASTPVSALLGSKFRSPAARRGMVRRTGLVDRLLAADEPVISVVAPPGYGKTTLLAQWAERRGPRVAWVSCEGTHNDPVALWSALIKALNAIGPVDSAATHQLATNGSGIGAVPGFVAAIESIGEPVTVVLDHLEVITSKDCQAAIEEFALRVPQGWQLAMASRERLPIPDARLRVERQIVEIDVADLAMTGNEARALLSGAGVQLSRPEVEDLVQRTEGWPVGLYLAALALRAGAPPAGFTFTGDDRLMGDYLRSELLPRVTATQAAFLIRTSVLDRISGPLCDAVVGGVGSAALLEQMESRNLLIVPLDRRREWYRYHHLLRELLQAELRIREPNEIPRLHSRAAAWYEANAMPEEAIEHALAADDADRVAALVLELMHRVWASGRADTVQRWMEWLQDRPSAQHYAAIAAHGALIFALIGRTHEAGRWVEVAERLPPTGTLPDGSTVAGTLAYLRAILCREGPKTMRRDALAAWQGLSPASPYRATMLQIEGVSYLVEGNLDLANAVLARAVDSAIGVGNLPLAALTLAERFLVADELDDAVVADRMLQRSVEIVNAGGFDGYWTSALVFAGAARTAAYRGDILEARRYASRAARLRPLLTFALPVVSVQALIELARAYISLVDLAGAVAVLEQASSILQQRPELGALPVAVKQLKTMVEQFDGVSTGASSLTTAELRLVPFLPTHLTMPEIGERLYISRHTVKSQVGSLYRKLGVSSRGEAVARISQLGLHT